MRRTKLLLTLILSMAMLMGQAILGNSQAQAAPASVLYVENFEDDAAFPGEWNTVGLVEGGLAFSIATFPTIPSDGKQLKQAGAGATGAAITTLTRSLPSYTLGSNENTYFRFQFARSSAKNSFANVFKIRNDNGETIADITYASGVLSVNSTGGTQVVIMPNGTDTTKNPNINIWYTFTMTLKPDKSIEVLTEWDVSGTHYSKTVTADIQTASVKPVSSFQIYYSADYKANAYMDNIALAKGTEAPVSWTSVTQNPPTQDPPTTEQPPVLTVKTQVATSFYLDDSAVPATQLVGGKTLKAVSSITNKQDATQSALLIVALYNPQGAMVNISYASVNIASNATLTPSAGFKLPDNVTGYTVRSFVWKGQDIGTASIEPLSGVTTLP
jgi:hypothetical protein